MTSVDKLSDLKEYSLLSLACLNYLRACLRFATSNTFRKQFYGYLLPNGYVERVSRDIYRIAPKGEKLITISSRS